MSVCIDNKFTQLTFDSYCFGDYVYSRKSEIASLLLRSQLTSFTCGMLLPWSEMPTLLQIIPHTSLTCLDLSFISEIDDDVLIFFFSNLHLTAITELNLTEVLSHSAIEVLQVFSQNLKLSKLRKLDLSCSKLTDHKVDILTEGLIQSNVTDLDLSFNLIKGLTTLGYCLKDTCITYLRLDNNALEHHGIFLSCDFIRHSSVNFLLVSECGLYGLVGERLIESLKFSKVAWVHFAGCNLQPATIAHFAEVVKDSNLEMVDLAQNNLSLDSVIILGESLKGSKVKTISLRKTFKHAFGGVCLPVFLEKLKSFPEPVSCNRNYINPQDPPSPLTDSDYTSRLYALDLSSNELGIGMLNLVEPLKFTFFTRLFLDDNKISDDGVKVLAEALSKTRLVKLGLSQNNITSHGAKTLALALKSSSLLCLWLHNNQIGDDGMEALAEGAKNTFLTSLSLSSNPGKRQLLVDAVLWNNKLSVHRFLRAFKAVAPRDNETRFNFDTYLKCQDGVDLECCLDLYRVFQEQPSAISVLLEDLTVPFSREVLYTLVSEEFPSQLAEFIVEKVQAKEIEHVDLLEQARKMGLTRIVEVLNLVPS